jgi:ATF/CREB family transcription factor
MSHLPGRFGQNNQQNEQRNFPPNSYQNNSSESYQGAAQNAAAAAANGLFLLSQAHQELTKREEAAQAANHAGGSKRNGVPGHSKRKSTDSGPVKPPSKKTRSTRSKRGRQSDDEMDGSLDGMDMDMDDSDAEGELYDMEGNARGGSKPKKAETEEEKRKNFLERNRQGMPFRAPLRHISYFLSTAALKCRQRKKAWLTQLQAKVEYLTAENDRLASTLTGKFPSDMLHSSCADPELQACEMRSRDYRQSWSRIETVGWEVSLWAPNLHMEARAAGSQGHL